METRGVVAAFMVLSLLAGCGSWPRRQPISANVVDTELTARLLAPRGLDVDPPESVVKPEVGGQAKPGSPQTSAVQPLTSNPHDRREPEATLFSLPDAIAYALRHNPRLLSARAGIDRARGQEQVAFAPFLPQVDFLAQYGVTSFNEGPGIPGPTGFVLVSGLGTHAYAQDLLGLQQLVCDFGRTGGRYRQVVAREQIAQLQLVRADQTVAFDVTTAYTNVLLARASRRVQEEAIRLAQAVLSDTRARRKGGTVDRDAVLRAEVYLAVSRSDLVTARETELDALARLNHTMGRNTAWPLQVVDLESPPASPPPMAECLEKAAGQRPEIALARQALAAAHAGEGAARAEFLPRIYARTSAGRIDGVNVLTGWQGGAGLHVEMPLYTGGRRRGEIRSAEADVLAAVADAQAILDAVSLEVTLAYRRVLATAELIELSRVAVVQAEENLRLVRVKYRNGDATPTDIVDVETSLTRSRQSFHSAVYSQLAGLARLNYALGLPQDASPQKGPDSPEGQKSLPEQLSAPRKLPGL